MNSGLGFVKFDQKQDEIFQNSQKFKSSPKYDDRNFQISDELINHEGESH